MAPRPSSPTSLLWAHQLKREHGHLLKRMQNLESTNEKHENRIKTAETAATANASGEIEALAKEVKALDHDTIMKQFSDMEKNVTQKVDDVQAESEAIILQVAALQKDERMAEHDRKKNLEKDKALLKRIGEVEEGLKKYEQSLDGVGKRINGTQFEQIKAQLDTLTKQVIQEGSQMKMLTESVTALEAANLELIKANERLEVELKKRASMTSNLPPQAPMPQVQNALIEADATPGAESEQPNKRKSHKWAGGGADKEIIDMGSGSFDDRPTVITKPSPKAKSVPKKSQPAPASKKPPMPKKKPTIPKKRPVPKVPGENSDRKSHKWAGGGADRAIIAAGLFDDPIIKREPSNSDDDDDDVAPKKKAPRWSGSGGDKVIRSGKGWYEIARSPTEASEDSGLHSNPGRGKPEEQPAVSEPDNPPAKRGRGRPRKYPVQALATKDTTAKRTIGQDEALSTSKKRKADEAFEESPDPLQAAEMASKQSKPNTVTTGKEPNVYSSPSPSDEDDTVTQSAGVIRSAFTSQAEQAPPKVRRQIVQYDDDISTLVGQMSGG